MSWLANLWMLGSPAASPPVGSGILFCDSAAGSGVWQTANSYSVGQYMNATGTDINVTFQCITAGTSAGTEPTWNQTVGADTVDGTVTWRAREADNWEAAFITVERAINAYRNRLPAVNVIWMEEQHLEFPTTTNFQILPATTVGKVDTIPTIHRVAKITNLYSPARGGSYTSPNFKVTGSSDITFSTMGHWHGIGVEAGKRINLSHILGTFEDCLLTYGVSVTSSMTLSKADTQMLNCTITAKAFANNYFQLGLAASTRALFRGCTFDIDSSTSGLIQAAQYISYQELSFIDCDLSALTQPLLVDTSDFALGAASTAVSGRFQLEFVNCRLPVNYSIFDGTWVANKATWARVENCSSNGVRTFEYQQRDLLGNTLYNETTYLDTGYQDTESATRLSLELIPTVKVNRGISVESPIIGGFFSSIGAKTITIELIENFTTALTTRDLWLELHYLKGANDSFRTIQSSKVQLVAAESSLLPGIGLTNWTAEPSGSRSVKLEASVIVARQGEFQGVVKLAKYEAGKQVFTDLAFTVS